MDGQTDEAEECPLCLPTFQTWYTCSTHMAATEEGTLFVT